MLVRIITVWWNIVYDLCCVECSSGFAAFKKNFRYGFLYYTCENVVSEVFNDA
jgi:hypothetical protein